VTVLGTLFVLLCAASGLWTGLSVARLTRQSSQALPMPTATGRGGQPVNLPALPATAQATLTFTGHRQAVRALAWSPDGSRLASGDVSGQVLVWDQQGRVLGRVQAAGPVRALAWSPDGGLLAIGAGAQIAFVRATDLTVVADFPHAHAAAVTAVSWSRHGPSRLVSTGLDRRAIVWDGTGLQPLLTFTRHAASIEAATWAADGATIASSSLGGVVRVWRATDGQEIHGYFLIPATALRAAAFAPSGRLLAVGGDDGIVRLWNNGLTCALTVPSPAGMQCQDSPTSLRAHTGAVRQLAFAPDGRALLAIGGQDGVLALWSPRKPADAPLLTVKLPHPVLAVAWSPDGRLLATAEGTAVTLWLLQ
jgi:WD40 repeat protein